MQNISNLSPAASTVEAASVSVPAIAAPEAAAPAKPAKPAKPRAAKPAPVAAKPVPVPAAPASDVAAERKAARDAISTYYSGRSLPFKSASDTFATLRTDKAAKAPTTRQAALLAAMLIAGDNVNKRGEFKRGGFTYDGRNVQPETGCLSDMLGRAVYYVSGPLSGKQARDAIFRIDLARARAEISAQLGDSLAKLAIAKLDQLAPAKPAKPAKAA